MDSINKNSFILYITTLFIFVGCTSTFEQKLSLYMKKDMPACNDTTYWKMIDLQDVVGVEYDTLYLLNDIYEKDIPSTINAEWNGGNIISDEYNTIVLTKDNHVVFKDVINNSDKGNIFIDFDILPRVHTCDKFLLKDTSTLYYVRVDKTNGELYYTLYNKERKDKGKEFCNKLWWFRN